MASHLNKLIRSTAAALLALFVLLAPARAAFAQAGVTLQDPRAEVDFGKTITFRAVLKSTLPIQQATLFFKGARETVTHVETVLPAQDGSVSFAYDASLNLIPPFSDIEFWYQVTLSDNQTYTTQTVKFFYADNRFPWREATRANVTVRWYAQDEAFGAAALDVAAAGMLAMQDLIPLSLDAPIYIYVYANPSDLQTTLALGGSDWAGGHATPQAGVALVAIPPGANPSDMQTKIPHELTHILLYRSLGEKYNRLPTWFLEGVASMMEQYANPDYAYALQVAAQKDTLIPFQSLCAGFPPDAGGAYLAYAQSQSFVTYISRTYGVSGLSRLMSAYGDGLACEMGATRALGTPLSQIEARWREDALGQNVAGVALRNLSPFFLLLALALLVPLWGTVDTFILRYRRKHAAAKSK
ncbi:MAG: hypothetical protein Fur002_11950 [Anaerolineales bacterium]